MKNELTQGSETSTSNANAESECTEEKLEETTKANATPEPTSNNTGNAKTTLKEKFLSLIPRSDEANGNTTLKKEIPIVDSKIG